MMIVRSALLLGLAVTGAAPAAAAVVLLANGQINGSAAGKGVDLSGLTGALENGLPGNILGGMGSGLAYAGGNSFVATPDRGPNATPYNSAVDDTSSYISRFQTLRLSLSATPGGSLPFKLSTSLNKTTLLSSKTALNYGSGAGLGTKIDGVTPIGSGAPSINTADMQYFTGRSDNYGAGNSGNPANARFDPESIRVANNGQSVFISDEYGPYVRQFDRRTGSLIRTFTLPANLDVTLQSPQGAVEIAGNAVGRVANKGMEGLALTPDGKTLVGIMQAPLEQDAAIKASNKLLRIVTIDIATGATHEFGYTLTTGSGVSDIVAINNHEFLVDERDGKGLGDGSTAVVKQLFRIDLAGAVDITALTGKDAAAKAVGKSAAVLDIVAALGAHGIGPTQVPAKIEGLAFGQDVTWGGALYHTLYVANDNDFVPGIAGPNQFYVFGFQDADLPGYAAQTFNTAVPEPATWAMMLFGFGLAGAVARRRSAKGVAA